jgi:hypothetical protein
MDSAIQPANVTRHDRGFSPKLVRQCSAALASVRGAMNVPAAVLQSLAEALQREVSQAEAVDALAQAVVCGSAIADSFAGQWHQCRAWLLEQSAPWERFVLEQIGSADGPKSSASFSELTHLYEQLLRHEQPERRKRAGVFYTPQPIVRYMLQQIDRQLRDEFHLPLGLADGATWGQLRQREPLLKVPRGAGDGEPFVRLFDPAVGTGAFLLDAIDFIHASLTNTWREDCLDEAAIADRWNDYVPRHLLPRLWGMELMPAPCFLARLHVTLKLAQTGYRFQEPGRIEIHLGNTLAGPTPPLMWGTRSASALPLAERVSHFCEPAYDIPFTVVLGNPPFSYLSENQSDWITSLVRGENGHAGYLQAGGQKLGEKKTWLHDDYVKFLRYAQWRIETTGCGIGALVTNHGYLTNATFRILRQQLLRAFPRISVIDLHGNRKAREVPPDGSRDENVFSLDQGIAVGFFRRPPGDAAPKVEHAELWGSRKAKFERLSVGQVSNLSRNERGHVENLSYVPTAPEFRFVPSIGDVPPEYAAAPSLADLLPLHATAPVTARDHFVVACTRQELCERIETFRDLTIPDEEIRRRYLARTRSPRYTPGDTRSWKLSDARRILAAESDWETFIQPCQYRPLDWRWIFWHPAMIDWPRTELTQHLVTRRAVAEEREGERWRGGARETDDKSPPLPIAPSPTRLALLARRQIPPSEPCTYFWVTSGLTLDGVIRNDNRGSESLFLSGASFPTCLKNHSVPPLEDGAKLACFAYALFHSPTYRLRYAAALRSDFPRVLMPRDQKLAAALADRGRQLMALHAQRPAQFEVGWDQRLAAASCAGPPQYAAHPGGPAPADAGWSHPTEMTQRLLVAVAPRFPQFAGGRIWIRDDFSIAAAEDEVWQFRVGAHQLARKWLADRRGRPLSEADLAWYAIVLDAIRQTRALMSAIDAVIDEHGGFPAAFQ